MDIDAIRARMENIGLKNKDLAEWIGISADKVSKALKGVRAFKADEMDRIREVLRLADTPPPAAPQARTMPLLGMVSAGRWQEAMGEGTRGERIPAFDPHTPKNAFAVQVTGDSMDRLIEDGGTIIVDPDDRALYPKRYYVVRNSHGDTTFKQFLSDPARLAPCSTNPVHKEMLIGEEPFEIVGRVIWRGSRM